MPTPADAPVSSAFLRSAALKSRAGTAPLAACCSISKGTFSRMKSTSDVFHLGVAQQYTQLVAHVRSAIENPLSSPIHTASNHYLFCLILSPLMTVQVLPPSTSKKGAGSCVVPICLAAIRTGSAPEHLELFAFMCRCISCEYFA